MLLGIVEEVQIWEAEVSGNRFENGNDWKDALYLYTLTTLLVVCADEAAL